MASSEKRYNNTFDVIVIGAGAAGIACMAELLRRGYKNILCLEALNEPGGRVKFNKKFGDIGGMCLHLPEKFHNLENLQKEFWGAAELVIFAEKNGFKLWRENNKQKFRLYRNGQKIKEGEVNRAISLIESAIESAFNKISRKELQPDISLQDALSDLVKDDICRTLISTIFSSTDTGLDAADISFLDYFHTLSSTPGLFPEDGMGVLLKAYARSLKNFISLNKEVTSVRNEDGLCSITYMDTATGNFFKACAHKLVITVSVGVLQSWIKENKIILSKEKITLINNIKMGHLNKNILIMDELFFTDNNIGSFTHINIRSNRLNGEANFLALKMHDKCFLINFVGGRKSLLYEKNGLAYARNDSLRILASVFGKDVYTFCIDSYLSQWSKNKYFYGSYSAATKDNFNSRMELSKPLDRDIYKAGEEVHYSEDEFSFHTHISGALHSGFIAANQVIRALESGNA